MPSSCYPLPARFAKNDRGAGSYAFWYSKTERGVFTYDWGVDGPYRRVAVPKEPIRVDRLRAVCLGLSCIVELPTRFQDEVEIDLAALGVDLAPQPENN